MPVSAEIANTIVDPKAYADGRIDQALATLRREAPLARIEADGYAPFWLVTRHADVLDAGRRNEEFHSADRPITLTNLAAERAAETEGQPAVRTLIQMDPPDHLAFRGLTQSWFMPKNLRKLEGRIREIARGFVDRMAAMGGECDFARDIALFYPLHIIMEILGVPEPDEPLMLRLTQEVFGAHDEDLNRGGAQGDTAQAAEDMRAAVMEFVGYFSALAEDRRRSPRGDLASVIANGEVLGQPLNFADVMGYYVITATAGHDTTSNTTASALWALAERPDALAALKADPSLIPGLVDESIRWATTVKHFMRSAAADVELGGQIIPKGDWLMLSYQSANRDEAVFDRPFEFDIRRSPNKHLAFGYGPHVCLGQHLGRMEMRILWEELLPRLDSLELSGEPQLAKTNFISGPKHVPVRYAMS
jgi:cytochrome P450